MTWMPKELDPIKYARMFVSESSEYLRVMNDSMLELEKSPDDRELVDRMFRSAHTVKGMASMIGYHAVEELAHVIEDMLGQVRDGHMAPTGETAEMVFKGLDALEEMVEAVARGQQPKDRVDVVQEIRELLAAFASANVEERDSASGQWGDDTATTERVTPQEEPSKDGHVEDTITVVIRLGRRCSLPSARALVIIKELAKGAEILASTPTAFEIEKEAVFEDLSVVARPGKKFRESLRRIAAMTDVELLLVGSEGVPRDRWQKITREEASSSTTGKEAAHGQTVRVTMGKLDDLLDSVGELVIGRNRLIQKASTQEDHELLEISTLIDRLTSDIQSRVLGIRMISLDSVMSRFPRMVRDIAKSEGKEAELVVESGNIELDRTVADRIVDPMMHLLRNCVDHGIEPVEERVRAGKRPKGLVRIVASKQQDHVLIEVSDDGKGIDFDAVRKTAVANGTLTAPEAESASGRELIDLLFRAGFSTKANVTEVSGRGVGLDVVRKSVEGLGGTVMVSSSRGAGTTFSLSLPLTLAIVEAMLVGIDEQTYAVPMSTIVETHRFEPGEIRFIRNHEVVQLRGEVLPLIRMRDFFGIDLLKRGSIDTLVVQSRDRRAALEVDELVGHQQIVVKPPDQRLGRVRGISGGTILGSGRVALILDVDSVLGG